ncbi:DNA-3-methyladenine glycosylase family protein [Thermotalea metallivorans]|uniref:DNA-3-methyladenine glycosylase II n=1 Tax=Thermotalea metallivorans TaxID=520762 RepID=A0A140L0Q1_9FIRM|nr:DNA-3-methyladenine glycosylase [Thermotalea metallivorans]KXG74126.1 DNA-3-methyladenine glycosylase 2 [Thermotalea metallivorans]
MGKILYYTLQDERVKALCERDVVLARLIQKIGNATLELEEDYFRALAQTIIGQQLSIKAAATIWNRTQAICGEISPATILQTPGESLRGAGISRAKISYLKDLSDKVLRKQIDLQAIPHENDEEAKRALMEIKGIGRWSAEMFLIFSLGRENIMSLEDAGLKRAVRWLYDLDVLPDSKTMGGYGERWKPYCSIASLYLWEAINRGWVNCPRENIIGFI